MDDEPTTAWVLLRLDPDGTVTSADGEVDAVLGAPAAEIVGLPVSGLARPGTPTAAAAEWSALADRPRGSRRQHLTGSSGDLVVTTVHRPGGPGQVEIMLLVEPAGDGDRSRLADLPAGRPLAGARRRDPDGVVETLSLALAEEPGTTLVVVVDLDDFAEVNRRFGRGGGNAVLDAVAERLRSSLRPSDVLGQSGDEFVLVCRGVGDGGVPAIGRRIGDLLADPVLVTPLSGAAAPGSAEPGFAPQVGWVPSASFGAVRPVAGESAAEAIDRARHAMAVAKRERRAERLAL